MKNNISLFIAAILFIISVFFAIRGHTYEYKHYDQYSVLSQEQSKFYRQKKNHHQSEGILAFERAHEKFWWLPRMSDRAMARSCLTSALTTATASTPQSKIMASIINLMITYGLACMDEWDYINYNLREAEHNFELMEFYSDVLNRA